MYSVYGCGDMGMSWLGGQSTRSLSWRPQVRFPVAVPYISLSANLLPLYFQNLTMSMSALVHVASNTGALAQVAAITHWKLALFMGCWKFVWSIVYAHRHTCTILCTNVCTNYRKEALKYLKPKEHHTDESIPTDIPTTTGESGASRKNSSTFGKILHAASSYGAYRECPNFVSTCTCTCTCMFCVYSPPTPDSYAHFPCTLLWA